MAKIYVPGVGFRNSPRQIARPVRVERDGHTLTVELFVASENSTDIVYDFGDLDGRPGCMVPSRDAPQMDTVRFFDGEAPVQVVGCDSDATERSRSKWADPDGGMHLQ
jgi:hypothetical protein